MKINFFILLLCLVITAHARIDHDGKDHKIEETRFKNLVEAANFFNGNLIGVSDSKRAEALSKLRRLAANYPELDAFRKKIEKMNVKDPMRIEMKLVENTVTFSVFWKDTGKKVYSVDTTPAMADYYAKGLKDSGRCDVGCQIIPISPNGGSR